MENTQNNTVDRKDLKIQALLEKVSQLTTQYENMIADFRVEITMIEQEKNLLQQQLNEDNRDASAKQAPTDDA